MDRKQINKFIVLMILSIFLATLQPGRFVMAALPILDGSLNEVDELTLSVLDLLFTTDPEGTWSDVFGNLSDGFALVLEPTTEYYYLDVDSLTASEALEQGLYPFTLDTGNLPADFYPYWEGRGVYEGCTGAWEPTMWQIITGIAPMFYLQVDGTSYDLVDGLLYLISIDPENPVETPLRINGDYPLGDYSFSGTIIGESSITAEINVDMRFTSALILEGLTLLESEDGVSGWTDVYGDLNNGFYMLLDVDPDTFEYLDVDALVVNNPLADGLYPFYLDNSSLPANFYDYWAAKGVVSGATGWLGVMWEIITGAAPMFYLKVDEASYDLVDGLQYLISSDPENPDEEPLRISEDYPTGAYGFDGQLDDIYGTTTDVSVEITLLDAPLSFDQDIKTYLEIPVSINLEAVGEGTILWWRSDPSHGKIVGTSPNLSYTPDPEYTGPDSFTFYIVDEHGSSNVATVDIMVYNRPSLSSDDLGNAFLVNENQEFNVRLQNFSDGDIFTNVLVKFCLEGASLADITSFEYLETSVEPDEWQPLSLVEEEGDLVGYFGPTEGFPMGTDYDVTSLFRVTFATLGDFPAIIEVYDLVNEPELLLTSFSTTVRVTVPFEVTDIALSYSNDQSEWFSVPSSSPFVFEMRLDQTTPWYYLDSVSITSNRPVVNGFYPFFLDVESLPDEFYDYWAGRNVFDGTTGVWEPLMWEIITGEAPIFYLEVVDSDLMLVDGLLYAIDGSKEFLRFEGNYWPSIYTFIGSVTDEYGLDESLSVVILLNDRPLTINQSLSTSEDVPLEFDLDVVDYYPGTITIKYTDFPDHGELILTNEPTIIYTPDANFHGTDYFSYRAYDGIAYSRFTNVTITVESVNDAPEAFDDSYYTAKNTSINIVLETIDVDGDPLEYSYVDLPEFGAIGGQAPNLLYTPNDGFVGLDSFVFQVSDGEYTDSATIKIYVSNFDCFLPLIIH
jgi:hypothetical protein